jgi:hypothetical protein
MVLENTKKNIMRIKIIVCIIINILKLKELHSNITSTNLINKFVLIKELSKITYNMLTFNIISVVFSSIPLCMKLKKIFKK